MQAVKSTNALRMRLVAAPAPRALRRTVVFSAEKGVTPAPAPVPTGTPGPAQTVAQAPIPQAPVAAAAAASPTFNSVMGFSGTAPEIVNGRLAMLGFVAAVGAELSSGEAVLKQLTEQPAGIAAVFLLIVAGSLVPAFNGSRSEALGPLTPSAELINGRAAMIGFAAMLVIEALRSQALF